MSSSLNATPLIELTKEEQEWLASHTKIRVGGSLDWTPFNFVDEQGQYSGIANDYLSLVSKYTGLEYEVITDTWDNNLQRIQQGRLDVLPAVYITDERKTYLHFSPPYFEALDYFFIHQDVSANTFEDLDGKRLAMPKGYAHREIIEAHFPDIILVDAETFGDAIDMVLEREADILFDTYGALIYTLEIEGISTIKPFKSTRHLGKNPIHFATSKAHPLLASIIKKGLDAISEAERRAIYNKWFQTSGTSAPKTNSEQGNLLALTDDEKAWLKQHPVINVAGDYAWAPFEFRNEQGLHDGLGHDLLERISLLTGAKFHFTTDVWEKSLQEVKDKEKDLLVAAFKTEDREEYLLFTNPYVSALNYFFIRSDIDADTIEDLSGKTLAIIINSAREEEIGALIPNINTVYVESPEQAIAYVSEGRADFLYDSHAVINYLLTQNNVTNVEAFKTIPNSPVNNLHIAVRDDYEPLVGILNKALVHLENTDMQSIMDRWLINKRDGQSSQSITLSEAEKEWLNRNTSFTIVGDPLWMPFEGLDENNNHVGIIQDYLDIFSEALNVEFSYIPTDSWQESERQVIGGNVDMVAAFPDYKPFGKLVFTDSYINTPIVFVTQNENKYIENISQVLSKRITLLSDYPSTKNLTLQYPNKHFYFVDTPEQGLDDLSSGKTDIFIGSLAQVNYHIAENGYSGLRVVGKTDYNLAISFAVQPEHAPLIPLLNRVLDNIPTATKQDILDHWGNSEPIVKTDYKLIFFITLIAILIISFVFIWNRRLQLEIALRSETEQSLIQSEKNLSVVINNIPVIVYVVDLKTNKLLMANHNAISTLKLNENEITSLDASLIYSGTQIDINEQQLEISTLAGEKIDGLLSIIPIRFHGETALLHIAVNLNERIAMERALEEAKNNAVSANKAKSEFLANMSHEIRTPMNAIIGFTELLHEQVKDNKLRSFVKTIKSAGNSLLMLINDILDLSKIEAGKLSINKEVCNPHNIFEDISNIFTMNVRSKGLDFLLQVDEKIPHALLLDSTRIRQILFNLVGNAVKFTDEGIVTLQATALNEDEIHSKVDLRIDVKDTGIGIDEDKVTQIFDSFQQQEGQSVRKYGGTGLGLTISKRLTELMDGTISVSSELGKGSCFSVYLHGVDIASIEEPRSNSGNEPTTAKSTTFTPGSVLIVDDVADNRDLLVEIFNGLNFECKQASNGLEAVAQTQDHQFDIIIMDIRMPEMDGYQAANIIKSSSPNIPIVALTASVMRDDYERQRRENFSGYLRKPILQQELIEELKKHLPYKEEDILEEDNEAFTDVTAPFRKILIDEYLPLCEALKQSNNLGAITTFANDLILKADEYGIESVRTFAQELVSATEIFDIVSIKKALSEFSSLCKS
ncbi:transporter substrate-binding domain-containing protein [Alteromonas sp. KUL49]|uniref:transporter substrate-binding domain-containing protein n=1 Tax=Alteromonas sp. KUL49 TaxID=2480798 RepID=UPI0010FFB77F|nr:transporter substrate-binding domain-containing protein [Alteromonas sp. KUL49]GEA10407.1 hypothetical protein KUL49_07820 [Alteromonas sp. KUL49]